MNILLINHYAGSPRNGMEYRPYYLASEWNKAGHNVSIVGSSFSHLRTHQPECARPVTVERINEIRYIWIKTPKYSGNDFKRAANMFSFAWQVWTKSLPIDNPDVVIDSSTYPLTIYGSKKIADKHRAHLVFEVHDLWPLTPMELGGYSRWHPFIVVMQWAETYAYRNSNRVVSILPKAKEYMISHGMQSEKFVYIPNGIDPLAWKTLEPLPEQHAIVVQKLKKSGKFVVGYAGAHGLANALTALVRAARILQKENGIHFLLVGKGPQKAMLQSLVRAEGLHNVSFLSPVLKICIPSLLFFFDAAYIGLKHEPLFRFGVSPNKLTDYLMAAKPVIYAIDAGNDAVTENGCGISVKPEDPEAIAEAILRLFKMSPGERDEMGRKGQNYVKSRCDYAVLATQFLEGL